jgi:hypothetical protein
VLKLTKLLDEAFARAQELSEEEQDYVAAIVLNFADREADNYQLTPAQLAEVELARQQIEDGHFISDEEMRKRWRHLGL